MERERRMIELILAAVLVGTMAKIASVDGESRWIWGGVALVLTIVCIALIPIGFFRLLVAGAVTFGAMITAKVIRDR